jgi:hypothetical protein
MKKFLAVVVFCLPAFGQAAYSGPGLYSGSAMYRTSAGGAPIFFAALPISWVDNTICNPPGGVYDTTVILGTTSNIGPNDVGEAVGQPYALTYEGLLDAMKNWRDNADNASQTPHFADQWWLIEIPNGTVLSGNTLDANNALISLPGKNNGSTEPAKCLVVDVTAPLPFYNVAGSVTSGTFSAGERVLQTTSNASATLMNTGSFGSFPTLQLGPMSGYSSQNNMYTWVGQTSGAVFTPTATPNPLMVCGRGLPGFGGARNPGCASPNDRASMWTVELEGPTPGAQLTTDGNGIHAGADLSNPSFCPNSPVSGEPFCWTNHVVVRDVEITAYPGSAQSGAGKAFYGFKSDGNLYGSNPCSTATPCIAPDYIGLDRYYIHGWDPGDPGQPSAACSQWTNAGTVTTSVSGGNTLVTYASGSYFGMTFAAGSTTTINGVSQTIIDDGTLAEGLQNGTQNTQFVISGASLGAGTYSYTQSNPPSKDSAGTFSFVYGVGAPVQGCGDDMVDGVVFETDYGWRQNGYIEKIHWWDSESHASLQGFSKGPYKDVNNWEEGGSGGWFNGGGPVDQSGGPEDDDEIRRNYQGRDLNYKYLTGATGGSPGPPWGCGPANVAHSAAAMSTCPMSWAVKNTMELKLGVRVLVDGNIIENSWADGQTGWDVVTGARTCSGGASCGIFDPVTGLPLTAINNVRFSNNWFRNAPSFATTGAGSNISPGDGGGISQAQDSMDYINNLGSNINDTNQNGNPNYEWAYGGTGDKYTCNMSYTGTGPYTILASCLPIQIDNSLHIVKVATDSAGHVQIFIVQRQDPMLCPAGTWSNSVNYGFGTIVVESAIYYQSLLPGNTNNSPSSSPAWWSNVGTSFETACQAAGQTLVIDATSDIPTGWAETYTMAQPPGNTSNWNPDGTGLAGTGTLPVLTTNETAAIGANQTLCDNSGSPTCAALLDQGSNVDITFASQGSRILDLNPGAGIYAYNCSTSGYEAGGASGINAYAIAPTAPASLSVYYELAAEPSASSATCTVNNIAGFPQNVTIQGNTFLSPARFAIQSFYSTQHYINNWFFGNVFADNDSGHTSDIFCDQGNDEEGTGGTNPANSSFACWDQNTLEVYNNQFMGRNCSYWNQQAGTCSMNGSGVAYATAVDPLAQCTGTSCANLFPALNTEEEWSTSLCSAANAPFNCPQMALPWANNFTLTGAGSTNSLAGMTGGYSQGVNVTQLQTALTQTAYQCPAGANCGMHGPYPD